jgi:histone H3
VAKEATVVIKMKHQWRPGTVALHAICKYQKAIDLLIRKAPFQRLVRKIANDMILLCHSFMKEIRMQSTAMLAIKEAAEALLVNVLIPLPHWAFGKSCQTASRY